MVFVELERKLPVEIVRHIIQYVMSKRMMWSLNDHPTNGEDFIISSDTFMRAKTTIEISIDSKRIRRSNTDLLSQLLAFQYLRKQYPSILRLTINYKIAPLCSDVIRIIKELKKTVEVILIQRW